jgi:predicted RNA-binding Zn-ribbon protein involved in translation (DUF1610 family)
MIREIPTEEVVKEFGEHKGINIEIAEKYFNHTCKECGKKVYKKDDIAMNMKLLGRNIEEFHCKKHLMKLLDIDKNQWDKYIEEFKQQGCSLF